MAESYSSSNNHEAKTNLFDFSRKKTVSYFFKKMNNSCKLLQSQGKDIDRYQRKISRKKKIFKISLKLAFFMKV